MKPINIFPPSFVICMSGLLIMFFLSAWAVVAMPSTPRAVASAATRVEFAQLFVLHLDGNADLQLIHRALAKLQAKGQVGRILSSSAISVHVEATAEAVAELEGISGVAKVTSGNLAHAFSSLSNESSRPSSQLVERWLLLELESEAVLDLLPQLFRTLARWQAEGTVSEFERVELNVIRVVMASDALSQLDTLNGVLDVSDSPFSEAANPAQQGRAPSGRSIPACSEGRISIPACSQGTTPVRPYWLVLKPTGSGDAPSAVLLKELARLQASGTLQQVEQTLKDNTLKVIKVIGVLGAEDLLHKLPTVLDVATVAPTTPPHQPQERALSSASQSSQSSQSSARLTPIRSPMPPPPLPTPPPSYPPPTPVGNSSIAGAVTAPDGTPLEGVEVVAFNYDDERDYWGWSHSALSDGNGQYTLTDLRSGRYRVGFFSSNGNYVDEYYNDARDLESATDVLLAEAQTVWGIDASLSQGGHITGIVTDEEGNPLPNVTVDAYQYNETSDHWQWVSSTQSDANGHYNVAGLRTGMARVGFVDGEGGHLPEFYDNAPDLGSATDISVTFEETTTGIDAQLADGSHITGTVTDQNGNPLPEVLVQLYDLVLGMYGIPQWVPINYAYTDSNGQYDLGGVAPGTYRVGFDDEIGGHIAEFYDDAPEVEDATDLVVTTDQTTSGIDAQLAKGGHITGTLRSDQNGNPLPEVEVKVYRYNNQDRYWEPVSSELTDSNGQYDLGGLRSGSYRVGFFDSTGEHASEYYNNAPDLQSATDIVVTEGETSEHIDASLSQLGHITGVVTDPDGNPLSDVNVKAFRYDDAYDYWEWVNSGSTNSNGQYDIPRLRSGTYRVGFFDSQDRYPPEFYNNALDVESATDVVVTPGETTSNINISLNEGGHITGIVSDANGNPLQWVTVNFYHYNSQYDSWQRINYTHTDASGGYDIPGLSSGTYRVSFSDWEGRYLPE